MQNNSNPSHLSFTAQRAAGYLLGFALLYAPFELYRRFLENVLNVQPAFCRTLSARAYLRQKFLPADFLNSTI